MKIPSNCSEFSMQWIPIPRQTPATLCGVPNSQYWLALNSNGSKWDWVWHCRLFVELFVSIYHLTFLCHFYTWMKQQVVLKVPESSTWFGLTSSSQMPGHNWAPAMHCHAGRWQTRTIGTSCGDFVFQCVSHVNPSFVPLSCRSCIGSNSICCLYIYYITVYIYTYTNRILGIYK